MAQTALHCTAPLSDTAIIRALSSHPQGFSKYPQDFSSNVKGGCLGMPVARHCC